MFSCFKIKPWTFAGLIRKAKVIECYDGDTITIVMWISLQRYSFRFRLEGIDAPEIHTKNKAEKYAGLKSKEYLQELILNKTVKIVFASKEDKYGRLLGTVYLRGKNINKRMVDSNHAKPYDGGKKVPFMIDTEEV